MLVGLLSDTHIPEVENALPSEVIEAFRGVDLILHGGDIYALSVLDDLAHIAPVLAARGDDDYGDTLRDERVKEKHILELEGQRIWLVHERPHSLISYRQNIANPPDIVIFGHEHRTVVEQIDGTLFVNAGSPTFLNYIRRLGTVGILELDSGKADVRILRL